MGCRRRVVVRLRYYSPLALLKTSVSDTNRLLNTEHGFSVAASTVSSRLICPDTRSVEWISIFYQPANVEIGSPVREKFEKATNRCKVGKYAPEFPPFLSRSDSLNDPTLLQLLKNIITLGG